MVDWRGVSGVSEKSRAGGEPVLPDRKVSETFLDFAAPLLQAMPADALQEAFERALKVAYAVWNAVVYADVADDPRFLRDVSREEVLEERERLREVSRRVLDLLDAHELWRVSEGREGERASLRGADLRGLELPGATLVEVDLERADLAGTVLSGACIESNLRGANLSGAYLERAVLERSSFEGACLVEAHLEGAAMTRCSFVGADMRRARLYGADLLNADFSNADLSEAELQGVPTTGPGTFVSSRTSSSTPPS